MKENLESTDRGRVWRRPRTPSGPALLLGFAAISLLVSCLSARAAVAVTSHAPSVTANGEVLLGTREGGVVSFKGIPFAAPALGELRWRPPQPPTPRKGPQDATRFAPACSQTGSGVDWYIDVAAAFGQGEQVVGRPVAVSEDCLYLNVWSPSPRAGANLPVMIFVHGGGNSAGWSYEPNYIGAALAAQGVVVVTIAYRLGPFGFFSHPALDNGDGEPVANFGLLDIRAAFGWVRENIHGFGGDPQIITGFGESAGALDLVDLLATDLSQGRADTSLFRRLILQSLGGPLAERQTLAEEQAIGERIVGFLGLPATVTVSELRRVSAQDLLAAAQKLPEDYYPDGVIDGQTLVRQPMEVIASARADGVALVLGTNADEWLMYLDQDAGRDELVKWAEQNAPGRADALLASVGDETDPRRALDRLITAKEMLCPSRSLADFANLNGGHGWIYYFGRKRNGPGGARLGAYHGSELPYVFGTHDEWLPTDSADTTLTRTVMDYWVSFARNGDPNLPGRPEWPTHTKDHPVALELGEAVVQVPAPDDALCRIFGPRLRPGDDSAPP